MENPVNFLDSSLYCCKQCKGLFNTQDDHIKHQMGCLGNPFKSTSAYFACERKIFLQLFQSEDFQSDDGYFSTQNMSKDDSFLNHVVKIRLPQDIIDPSIFLRTPIPTGPPQLTPDPEFLLEPSSCIDNLEPDVSKTVDYLEPTKPSFSEAIEQEQIRSIINKNINYLKSDDISNLSSSASKSAPFPHSQSESRLLSPIEKHFLTEGSKSRTQSPFDKSVNFLHDGSVGFASSQFTYSSNSSLPYSCNLSTDLLSSLASTSDENQQSLLTNIEECPTLQYLDLAKKDPFFGQNLGLAQLNSKDPFLINATVKTDKAQPAPVRCPPAQLAKSCDDLQASPTFQLQDSNYFNFPSMLDEPTQLDYLDLATLDLLTNPNFVSYGSGMYFSKDDYFINTEQGNIFFDINDKYENKASSVKEGPEKHRKSKMKGLTLKKVKNQIEKKTKGANFNRKNFVNERHSSRSQNQKAESQKSYADESLSGLIATSSLKGKEKTVSTVSRKRKITISHEPFEVTETVEEKNKNKFDRKYNEKQRICQTGQILNIKEQLTGFTDEEKDSLKAVFGQNGCIIVKKQKLATSRSSCFESVNLGVPVVSGQKMLLRRANSLDERFEREIVENEPRRCTLRYLEGDTSHFGVTISQGVNKENLTSVLKLKCKECSFSCTSANELKEHCEEHTKPEQDHDKDVADMSEQIVTGICSGIETVDVASAGLNETCLKQPEAEDTENPFPPQISVSSLGKCEMNLLDTFEKEIANTHSIVVSEHSNALLDNGFQKPGDNDTTVRTVTVTACEQVLQTTPGEILADFNQCAENGDDQLGSTGKIEHEIKDIAVGRKEEAKNDISQDGQQNTVICMQDDLKVGEQSVNSNTRTKTIVIHQDESCNFTWEDVHIPDFGETFDEKHCIERHNNESQDQIVSSNDFDTKQTLPQETNTESCPDESFVSDNFDVEVLEELSNRIGDSVTPKLDIKLTGDDNNTIIKENADVTCETACENGIHDIATTLVCPVSSKSSFVESEVNTDVLIQKRHIEKSSSLTEGEDASGKEERIFEKRDHTFLSGNEIVIDSETPHNSKEEDRNAEKALDDNIKTTYQTHILSETEGKCMGVKNQNIIGIVVADNDNGNNLDINTVPKPMTSIKDSTNNPSVNKGQLDKETKCSKKTSRKRSKSEELLSCGECGYKTKYSNYLKEHMRKHDGNYLYCSEPDCDFKTIYRRNLNFHLQKHKGVKNLLCDKCPFITMDTNSLKRHIQHHHVQERRFKCPDCDFVTMFRGDVMKHFRNTHRPQKLYACNQCDYRTGYTHLLKFHLMAHAGIRPYKCSGCTYQVNNCNKVTRHIRTRHAGQSDVKCEKLDLTFEVDAKQFQCEDRVNDVDINVIELTDEQVEEYAKKKLKMKISNQAKKGKNNSNKTNIIKDEGVHTSQEPKMVSILGDLSKIAKNLKQNISNSITESLESGILESSTVSGTEVYVTNCVDRLHGSVHVIENAGDMDGRVDSSLIETVKIPVESEDLEGYDTAYQCSLCAYMSPSVQEIMGHVSGCSKVDNSI